MRQRELEKGPINDASAIAGGTSLERASVHHLARQFRKCNCKLIKGDRSHMKNTAPRFIHGFQRCDKVRYKGRECFISGRKAKGYFDLRLLEGTKIHSPAKCKETALLESSKTRSFERSAGIPPGMKIPGILAA